MKMYHPFSAKTLPATLVLVALLSACGQSNETPTATDTAPLENSGIDNDSDGFSIAEDCDDNNPLVHNPRILYIDADLDGFGSVEEIRVCALEPVDGQSDRNDDPDDTNAAITSFDHDGDGTLAASDCNDNDDSIALPVDYYLDSDSDGFGAGEALRVCSNDAPSGYVLSDADPDDENASSVPSDIDGDGIANNEDCAPDDASSYITQIYYADPDDDNIGSGAPVEMCVALPLPDIDHYSLVSGDSCPDHRNSLRDFDDDNIDDVCDQEIRVLTDKHISGNEYITFTSYANNKSFYFGGPNQPVTVTVDENATLAIGTTLYLEGGSRIVVKKTTYNRTPHLRLSDKILYGPDAKIIGIGDNNSIELYGASFYFDINTEIDSIEQIYVTPSTVFNPDENRYIRYRTHMSYDRSLFRHIEGRYYVANEDNAPTIENSPGHVAFLIRGQTLDVSPIRFLNNQGFPVKCDDNDLYRDEWEVYNFSACQYAEYSRYRGNLFNGPLLSVVYTNDAPRQDFRYTADMESLGLGSRELYIDQVSLQITDDRARSIAFQNYTFKARRLLSEDASGRLIDIGFPTHTNTIPCFRTYNSGVTPLAFINFFDSDIREVPVVIEGGRISVDQSQLGAVLFRESGNNSALGNLFVYDGSSMDFVDTPYVVSDGEHHYGIGLSDNFYGYVELGSNVGDNPVTTDDVIISDGSIRYPIIDITPMNMLPTRSTDHITASYFSLKKSVGFIGTDVNSVFGQDSTIGSLFLTRK